MSNNATNDIIELIVTTFDADFSPILAGTKCGATGTCDNCDPV